MDEEEVGLLNRELLDLLRDLAPWAAEQVEETVRQGKTVPIDVPRRRRAEMDPVVDETKSLGRGKLAMTQELTASESLSITLDAIECLLIQPDLIAHEVESHLGDVKVSGVSFVEPDEQEESDGKRSEQERSDVKRGAMGIPEQTRARISALLGQTKSDLLN